MFPYDPSEWHDLFVATAGASAALAGLLFVAVSINIERILSGQGLPARALTTLLLLLTVLVVSIAGLVPGQSSDALGVELLCVGLASLIAITRLMAGVDTPPGQGPFWKPFNALMLALGTVPIAIGGASVLATSLGGLYWVVAGIVFAVLLAMIFTWVLMVEILR